MRAINQPELYQYAQLFSSNQIRLLVIYPHAHLNAPVTASLLQTSLRKINTLNSPYDTLSYGRDSDHKTHQIICDGGVIPVSFECQVALRYLRHKSRIRTVWVDEVCVDQMSAIEIKYHEEKLKQIHQRAREVKVWLGEAEPKVRRVLGRVAYVGRWMQSLDDHAKRHPSSDAAGVRKLWTNRINPYRRISTSPIPIRWFTRLWALPEAVLDCNPTLVCGLATIPWNHFEEWCRCQPDGNALAPMLHNYPTSISKTSSELSYRRPGSASKWQKGHKRMPSLLEDRVSMSTVPESV